MSAPFALTDRHLEAALRQGRHYLQTREVDSPSLDARILFTLATGREYEAVLLAPKLELNLVQADAFERYINRRAKGEPVARIMGYKEFWGMEFRLNEATLVPRPDTETLVEAALAFIDARDLRNEEISIVDLGTGTGCVLAALLIECPRAIGVGTDISAKAVKAARENMERLGLEGRARILASDWFSSLKGRFHLVVSNPPYIGEDEIADLMIEVREHDPLRALTPGLDALKAYRTIIPDAFERLYPGGALAVEVGAGQARLVQALMDKAGFASVSVRNDLSGVGRAVIAAK